MHSLVNNNDSKMLQDNLHNLLVIKEKIIKTDEVLRILVEKKRENQITTKKYDELAESYAKLSRDNAVSLLNFKTEQDKLQKTIKECMPLKEKNDKLQDDYRTLERTYHEYVSNAEIKYQSVSKELGVSQKKCEKLCSQVTLLEGKVLSERISKKSNTKKKTIFSENDFDDVTANDDRKNSKKCSECERYEAYIIQLKQQKDVAGKEIEELTLKRNEDLKHTADLNQQLQSYKKEPFNKLKKNALVTKIKKLEDQLNDSVTLNSRLEAALELNATERRVEKKCKRLDSCTQTEENIEAKGTTHTDASVQTQENEFESDTDINLLLKEMTEMPLLMTPLNCASVVKEDVEDDFNIEAVLRQDISVGSETMIPSFTTSSTQTTEILEIFDISEHKIHTDDFDDDIAIKQYEEYMKFHKTNRPYHNDTLFKTKFKNHFQTTTMQPGPFPINQNFPDFYYPFGRNLNLPCNCCMCRCVHHASMYPPHPMYYNFHNDIKMDDSVSTDSECGEKESVEYKRRDVSSNSLQGPTIQNAKFRKKQTYSCKEHGDDVRFEMKTSCKRSRDVTRKSNSTKNKKSKVLISESDDSSAPDEQIKEKTDKISSLHKQIDLFGSSPSENDSAEETDRQLQHEYVQMRDKGDTKKTAEEKENDFYSSFASSDGSSKEHDFCKERTKTDSHLLQENNMLMEENVERHRINKEMHSDGIQDTVEKLIDNNKSSDENVEMQNEYLKEALPLNEICYSSEEDEWFEGFSGKYKSIKYKYKIEKFPASTTAADNTSNNCVVKKQPKKRKLTMRPVLYNNLKRFKTPTNFHYASVNNMNNKKHTSEQLKNDTLNATNVVEVIIHKNEDKTLDSPKQSASIPAKTGKEVDTLKEVFASVASKRRIAHQPSASNNDSLKIISAAPLRRSPRRISTNPNNELIANCFINVDLIDIHKSTKGITKPLKLPTSTQTLANNSEINKNEAMVSELSTYETIIAKNLEVDNIANDIRKSKSFEDEQTTINLVENVTKILQCEDSNTLKAKEIDKSTCIAQKSYQSTQTNNKVDIIKTSTLSDFEQFMGHHMKVNSKIPSTARSSVGTKSNESNVEINTAQTTFKRPSRRILFRDCPKSPDADELNNINTTTKPLLIPLEKPKKLIKKKFTSLLKRLNANLGNAAIVTTTLNTLGGQDVEHIAGLIIDFVRQDYGIPQAVESPFAPVLSNTQRTLLVVMKRLDDSRNHQLFLHFLALAEKTILVETNLLAIRSLTGLYIAVCKLRNSMDRLRRICCDAFYFMGDLAVPFLFFVLTSWIDIFPKCSNANATPLAKVLVQIIHMKTCNTNIDYHLYDLKDLLSGYYGYAKERCDSDEMMAELVAGVSGEDNKDFEYAILILSKNHNSEWRYKQIKTLLLPKCRTSDDRTVINRLVCLIKRIVSYFDRNNPKNEEYLKDITLSISNLSLVN